MKTNHNPLKPQAKPPAQKPTNGSVIIDHKNLDPQCGICLKRYPISDMADTCSQGHKFCKICLKTYLEGRSADFRGSEIHCPSYYCPLKFDDDLMRTLLSEESIKLYEAKKLEKMVAQNPDTKFCPKPGCSRVIKLSKNQQYTKCDCKSKICNACGEFWHENKTCEEVKEVELEACIQERLIRRCMMCKTLVQNTETCPSMICTVCDYNWCWLCGEQYVGNHYKNCTKEWKPEPPQEIINKPPRAGVLKGTILPVVYYILLLPVKFLFMGFFLCNNWKAVRDKNLDLDKRISVFFTVMVGCLVYDIGCIGLTLIAFMPIIDGEKTPGILYLAILFYLLFVVFLYFDLRSIFKERRNHSKRWQSGDARQFKILRPKAPRQVPMRGYEPVRYIGQKVPMEPTRNAIDIFFDSLPTSPSNKTNTLPPV